MSRLARAFCGAVVAIALSIGTVAAATPGTVEVSFHSSQPDFASCPGFAVDLELDITRRITSFVDSDGNPSRIVTHVTGIGTMTNPLTGKSLPDANHFTVTVDLVNGTRTFTGDVRVDTAPGAGRVFRAVGRLAFGPDASVLFESAPHDDLDGSIDALCAYLGGS